MTGFYSCHKLIRNFKSLYILFAGSCRLKIRDVSIDFKPYFIVHNLVSVHPKSIILGQMTNLNMIFHVVVSVYRLVKILNSPQSPTEFRNGQCRVKKRSRIGVWISVRSKDAQNPPKVPYFELTAAPKHALPHHVFRGARRLKCHDWCLEKRKNK